MAHLVLTTVDWVPETPRGYVRDLHINNEGGETMRQMVSINLSAANVEGDRAL